MDASSLSVLLPGRCAAVAFIFVTVMLDVLALGIIAPVLPKLVLGFLHGETGRGTIIFGTFGLIWAGMQFFSAPVLGALSDRFGRRPVILISNFSLGADYVLMALAPSLRWLFVGRMISGITAASIPTAMAYIADVTPPERRSALAWRRANPVAALAIRRSRPGLNGLAAFNFLCYLAHEVYPSVFVIYTGYRFHWDESTVGWTLCGVRVCTALTQALLTRPAVVHLGERGTILTGLGFGVLGFALYELAGSPRWFWEAIPLIAPWGIANPAIQSLLSRRVDPAERGLLQGVLGSLCGISGPLGPMLFTGTFAAFIPGGAAARGWTLPGAPFLLSSGLIFAALLRSVRATHGGPDAAPSADAPSGFIPEVS